MKQVTEAMEAALTPGELRAWRAGYRHHLEANGVPPEAAADMAAKVPYRPDQYPTPGVTPFKLKPPEAAKPKKPEGAMPPKASKQMDAALNRLNARLHATRQAKAEAKMQEQPQLFGPTSDTPLSPAELAIITPLANPTETSNEKKRRERSKLLPVQHLDRDFFLCDMFDYALKDDGVSMEAPIFTLATKPDISEWHWESKDGSKSVTVTPSIKGRATQFDKDVLIYVVSQMTEALNRGRSDAKNRTIRFTVYDYLVSTNKAVNGRSYERLSETFERLRGTTLKTNIKTGGTRTREIFGLIERAKIVEKSLDDERMVAVEVTLSEWLFNAVQAHEVLTLHPDYFRLRKPLERRLYELARKHCGHQTMWSIGLELLQDKAGSKCSLREFRRMVREIIEADTLPDYRLILDETDKAVFYTKDARRLVAGLAKK